MLVKEGSQSQHIYFNAEIEKLRYNPYRKRNREIAEKAYKNNEHLPFPLHVIVEVSSLCQLKCGFCNREVMTRPQMNMNMEVFKRVADQCAEGGVYSLSLYALGEPFLNFDLPQMITYAKRSGIPYVDVSTNGMIDMNSIVGTGLNEIIISVDGDKETHGKLRKGAKYNKIFSNIKDLKFLRTCVTKMRLPLIRLQMIDIPETHALIPEYIKTWKDIADVICIKKLEGMAQSLGDKLISSNHIKIGNNKCKQLSFILTVNSNGDIAKCCHDPCGESVVGNIKDMMLKEAWETEKDISKFCAPCVDWGNW